MIAPDRKSDLKITVLNPMGYPPAVTRKSAAPRPESLEGKTIYLVDARFDDSIELLKQVQAWFAEHMTGVKTKLVSLSAYYGHDDPKTWEEIKANGDAAIIGVGHCSTCAPAVATHAITLDTKYGVPTVAMHTHMFDKVVRSVTADGRLGRRADRVRAATGDGQVRRGAARLRQRSGSDHRPAGDARDRRSADDAIERSLGDGRA